MLREPFQNLEQQRSIKIQKTVNILINNTLTVFKSCRGRVRTFTRQLAVVQSSVVDPGQHHIAMKLALCYVYPVILTPETRGHVCQKFHHPTV